MFSFGSLFGGTRFTREFRCFPVANVGRPELEIGNRIILPPSALAELSNSNSPLCFEVSDLDRKKRTHAGVLEFIAPEETCYMPTWIISQLQAQSGDILRIALVTLPKATFVRFRPASVALLRVFNPRALLENGLRNYVALTEGDSFSVEYNKQFYGIEVLEVRPAGAASIIETDVEVDFGPPRDAMPKDAPKPSDAAGSQPTAGSATTAILGSDSLPAPPSVSRTELFGGAGQRIDGLPPTEIDAAPAPPSVSRTELFGGAGQRIDGFAPPEAAEDEEEDDEMPWKRRIPQGVKWKQPPYGYKPFGGRPATATLQTAAQTDATPMDLHASSQVLPGGDAMLPNPGEGVSQDELRARALEAANVREALKADEIEERRKQEEERVRLEDEAEKRRLAEEAEAARKKKIAVVSAPKQKQMGSTAPQPKGGGGGPPSPQPARSVWCGCLRSSTPSTSV